MHHFIEAERPPPAVRLVGLMLHAWRDFAGHGLADVERLTDISALTVRRIETGMHRPSFEDARALCGCYGKSLDLLAKCAAHAATRG